MHLVLWACLSFAVDSRDQLQIASLSAIVLDQAGQSVAGAIVILGDPLGAELQRLATDARGRATFPAVAPGRYLLQTRAPGAVPFDLPVTVTSALPVEVTVRVPARVTDAITVETTRLDDPSSRSTLGGDSLSSLPLRVRSRGLQDAVAAMPGWSTEDNGLLHARGIDDGFLYVIDGVPVYERIDALHGLAPDLTALAGVSVITGYVPPEFGHKAGGIIDVRTASAATAWTGLTDVTIGSDAARDASLTVGGGVGRNVRVRAGMVSARSDRFLDPIDPRNLHNAGGQANTFGQLDWPASSRDRFTAAWGYGRSSFDVPNNIEQEEAGQDQRQHLRQGFVNLAWQRIRSPLTVVHTALYHRGTRARLRGSTFDTPLAASGTRGLRRTGGLFAISRQQNDHLLKFGVEYQRLSLDEQFGFSVTDQDKAREADFRDEVLVFGAANPFRFAGRAKRTLWSAYAQDSWQLAPRVTASGGVRFDRSGLLLERSQVSPRLGVAVRLAAETVVRLSVSRFFQPPQPENLLLSSSPEARVLSSTAVGNAVGGADLEPERQWANEIGVEHRFGGRLRVDAAYWRRRIEDVGDPNVFAGTTIIFPNAVAKGRAHGIETRLEVARDDGWSAYLNASVARVVQTGPVTGGLFLDDEVEELGPGVEFTPDHDQRLTAGAGVTWEHGRSGLIVSGTARHETGTPIQQDDELDKLLERPGAEIVDFDAGRVKPRTVVSMVATVPVRKSQNVTATAGLQVLNLFDARYAYNFGNPFSGTHFGAPRTVAVMLRFSFR